MKEVTLLLLSVVALVQGGKLLSDQEAQTCECSEAQENICQTVLNNDHGVLLPHKYCDMFYKCSNGVAYANKCPSNLLYDPVKEICEWSQSVDCGDRSLSDNAEDGSGCECDGKEETDSGSGDGNSAAESCNCNPSEAPIICSKEHSDGVLVAHEMCNQFYICAYGKPVTLKCPADTFYNPYEKKCDWGSNVDCNERTIPAIEEENDRDKTDKVSYNDDIKSKENNAIDEESNVHNEPCNCDPKDAPSICAKDNSDNILVAHENCDQFYTCAHGLPVAMKCPRSTLYNPYKELCDWADNVECNNRVSPKPIENGNGTNNNTDNNNSNESNDNSSNGDTCNCNPEEAPSICSATDSDNVLVAHINCNQFYVCAHGQAVVLNCPKNTFYNPYKEECDWADTVDCYNRVIPEPEKVSEVNNKNSSNNNDTGNNDSSSTGDESKCNCNPSEAHSICSAANSDNILVAHENCNQFYLCVNGKAASLKCPTKTFYNPYKEECDWAANINCGDRVIPEIDINSNKETNNGTENLDRNEDINKICNCNPEEAPKICKNADSDGVLIAHEKCNKFYMCAYGRPVEFQCPAKTFYNPFKEVCDWEKSVKCID